MGPIFFETTVNSVVYQDIITQLISLLENDERDNATCHISNKTMNFLREFFGEHIISKGLWPPPHSPDISPPDFFLWGYLKERVFKNRLHTLDELRRIITTEINFINVSVLQKVATNVVKRARACINEQGSHFKYML